IFLLLCVVLGCFCTTNVQRSDFTQRLYVGCRPFYFPNTFTTFLAASEPPSESIKAWASEAASTAFRAFWMAIAPPASVTIETTSAKLGSADLLLRFFVVPLCLPFTIE